MHLHPPTALRRAATVSIVVGAASATITACGVGPTATPAPNAEIGTSTSAPVVDTSPDTQGAVDSRTPTGPRTADRASTSRLATALPSGMGATAVAAVSTAAEPAPESATESAASTWKRSVSTRTGTVARTTTTSSTGSTLTFGAVGDVAKLTSTTGSTLAVHTYGNLQGSVPVGQMVTVNASGLPWATVATAKPGSTLHNDMIRWAKAIKARGGSIAVAFGHEPELRSKAKLGTPAQYQAAYQKVVSVFRSQGVTNVKWVFQGTDWGFRTSPTDPYYAGRFYPGDAYVDIVGGDAYNWHTCGEGLGRDVPLSTVASGILSFAKAHGKKASLPEFAANSTVDRQKWLTEGYAWLKLNRAYFVSAYYFQHPPTNAANSDCNWPLNSAREFSALSTIAGDSWSTP